MHPTIDQVFWTMPFLDLELIRPGASTMHIFSVLSVLIIAIIAINLPDRPRKPRRVKHLHVQF